MSKQGVLSNGSALEDLPGCPVDLVTAKALRAVLRPFVEREALHV